MATHTLNKATTSTWDIDENRDIWILGEKGRIASDTIADGIFADDTIAKATIRIDGEIDVGGAGADGMDISAKDADISVGETGHIAAEDYAILYWRYDGTVTMTNKGLLEAASGMYVQAKQDSAMIRNEGHIHAYRGIRLTGAGASIDNSGVIKGAYGIVVYNGANDSDPLWAENATHIVNTGKITGADHSIYASDVAVNLRNKGTLNGVVILDDGQDVVNNRGGTINGDVWLGSHDDRFDGRGGRLNGVLYGGNGSDIVTLASPATLYVELAGEGNDAVRINATYRLGANVEDLMLLGKASHTGIGNSLDNRIYGNRGDNALYGLEGGDLLDGGKGRDRLDGGGGDDILRCGTGNDILTGGGGADYFQFKPGCGRDTITDFFPGLEHVSLQGFAGIADFGDLQDLMTQPGDDTIIRFSDTDVLILRDVNMGDLAEGNFEILG